MLEGMYFCSGNVQRYLETDTDAFGEGALREHGLDLGY